MGATKIGHVETLLDMLEARAEANPTLRLFSFLSFLPFLPERETVEATLTAEELASRARSVAAWLERLGLAGERILLLFPQGLDFISAYWGCIYAGSVALPAPMPHEARLPRTLPRLISILTDAKPAAILTDRQGFALARRVLADLPQGDKRIQTLLLEDHTQEQPREWRAKKIRPEAPAHLQYTSGSTSAPKGTIVTHQNILANSLSIRDAWRFDAGSRSVVWVPHFHDDGLVQGLIQPIFTGYPCFLMPADAFVARPLRWLQAITRFRATHAGGPNFAYELCLRKVDEAALAELDLSSWIMAYNAAEPVRADTLRRFDQKFAPRGFRWSALSPCFGLAEATLLVSGGLRASGPRLLTVDGASLDKQGIVRAVPEGAKGSRVLVGCGAPASDTAITIVDPTTNAACPADRVGEILVEGPSVAAGYDGKPRETEAAFRHFLDKGAGPLLRTGDQGFLLDGELFVTGRLKDLIIIRGENRYPQDIEWTVERSHDAIAKGRVAAFSVEDAGEERLVIAAELAQRGAQDDQTKSIFETIRERIAEEHDLAAWTIVLVSPGSLPKTSSGKLQRGETRASFLQGTLSEIARNTQTPHAERTPTKEPPAAIASPSSPRSPSEIAAFLVQYLAAELGVRGDDIDPDAPFGRYGLDSAASVRLAAELGDFLGTSLSPVAAWNHPSIGALSRHLAGAEPRLAPESAAGSSLESSPESSLEEIAIIGAACRFPGGVVDLPTLFRLLDEGVDAIEEAPANRPSPKNPRGGAFFGGFLHNIENFEPAFFEMSHREAEALDPQMRLLLELSWEALERAGHTLSSLRGSDTGVFMGIAGSEYQTLARQANKGSLDPQTFLGTTHSTSLARLSYWLGFTGPNIPIDTACSSSLVAVHLACQAIRDGDCSMALAGGVSLLLSSEPTVCLDEMRVLSPRGRCRAFSADADGYVRSEGAGVVVLARLSDALRMGVPILGIIRGSAVNQDGRSHGLTAPNGKAQEAVLRKALGRALVAPSDIGYVEAHGTGTPLGDPIEALALAAALAEGRSADAPLLIGSIKTNIGHTEVAAGIAGLLKVLVALVYERIPKSLFFTEPNPHIPWASLPLRVAAESVPWPAGTKRRFGGVSSFGLSGTNAHVILEQAPDGARALGALRALGPPSGGHAFRRVRCWFEQGEAPVSQPLVLAQPPAVDLRSLSPEARAEHLLHVVKQSAASVLGLDESSMAPNDSFVSLGVNSLLSMEIELRIEQSLGIRLPPTMLIQHLDLASLVSFLADSLAQPFVEAPATVIARRALDRSGKTSVSPGQAQIWFFDRLSPGLPLYHLHVGVRWLGPLDMSVLRRSLNKLVERHASLRTTFYAEDGALFARVLPRLELEVPRHDISDRAGERRNEALARLSQEQATAPFDLLRGPLLRVSVVTFDQEEHVMLLTHHHLITDGFSIIRTLEELAALYRGFVAGALFELPPLPIAFSDYAAFQHEAAASPQRASSLAWWKQHLAGLPLLDLPMAKKVAAKTYAGDAVSFTVPKDLAERVDALAAREGQTLFTVLLAAWVAVLHRYASQDDVPVGIASAGRMAAETRDVVGFFVNTLVLRCDVSGELGFSGLMQRIAGEVRDALAHEDVPFADVVRAVAPVRGSSMNPLYQASFVMDSVPVRDLDVGTATLVPFVDRVDASVPGTAKNELGLMVWRSPHALSATLEFATDIFDKPAIERMVGHFLVFLDAAVKDPERSIARLPLLGDDERRTILSWAGVDSSLPPERCVHRLFEEQCRQTPHGIAVECQDERLTYAELDARANRLAHHLRNLGVGPEVRVGLCVERSPMLLVGLLGIVKAGGTYVPLDVSYPSARISYLLNDARIALVITTTDLAARLPSQDAPLLCIDDPNPPWAALTTTPPQVLVRPDHALYVIYTSGSTGEPKGVVVEHRSVAALLLGLAETGRYRLPCKFLHRAPLSFDVSVLEIWGPLLFGGTVVMAKGDAAKMPSALASLLHTHGVTHADFPPALLDLVLDEADFQRASDLRLVTVGGEALDAALVRKFEARCSAPLWNNYGPTEATVEASSWPTSRLHDTRAIRIGRPLPGYRVYVLDKHDEVCPVGISGEICIGGLGVARGYLDKPEDTSRKFVRDPFSNEKRTSMVRTGDRARLCEDGEIEFLGRLDHQVKLHGYRIELGEIEAALSSHRSVRAAVALLREDEPGRKQLVVYVLPSDVDTTPAALRDHLRPRLPAFMIPSAFIVLSAWPLLPNGKNRSRRVAATGQDP